MDKLEVGTIVTTYTGGGMVGEIMGVASESVLSGNSYIVKILDRGSLETDDDKEKRGSDPAWEGYPYAYTVLSEKVLSIAPEALIAALRSLGKIPQYPVGKIVQAEQEMRDAVKNLSVDDAHLRKFLEKSAREYMASIGEKCEILNIYPLDFIVRVKYKYGYGGAKHIRIPVADFFEGESRLPQMATEMQDALKSMKPKVVKLEKKDIPNMSNTLITRETPKSTDPEPVTLGPTTKSSKKAKKARKK